MPRLLLAVLLVGCASSDRTVASLDERSGGENLDATEVARLTLQLNLAPSRLRDSDSDAFRVLPQTFSVTTIQSAARIQASNLVLDDPVVQTGRVYGYQVNPSVAALPGAEVDVVGRVRLYHPDSVQSYVTETDSTGAFETWAVPGAGYRLEIVPFDPLLPIYTDEIGVTDPTAEIVRNLGPGVPIYGIVTSPSGPVAGARIQLVDAFGAVSATAYSDEYGVYQVRATKGVWTVVCSGRDAGLDPTLRYVDQTVGELGLNLDVAYPAPLDTAVVQGRVETVDGNRVVNPVVRLTAESVDGYTGLDATFSTEVFAADNGSFVSLVPPGTYTVDVLPPEDGGDDLSPRRLTGVRMDDGVLLEPVQLPELVAVGGEVRGPAGAAISAARVVCEEVGFGGRAWESFTGEQGRFSLELPQVRVACEAHPPGHRNDLARAFLSFDPSVEQSLGLDLVRGQLVTGTVSSHEGQPEPTVVVEVRAPDGRVLGAGLTGNEGQFEIAVDLSTVTP